MKRMLVVFLAAAVLVVFSGVAVAAKCPKCRKDAPDGDWNNRSGEDLTAALVGHPAFTVDGYSPEYAYELLRDIVLTAGGGK